MVGLRARGKGRETRAGTSITTGWTSGHTFGRGLNHLTSTLDRVFSLLADAECSHVRCFGMGLQRLTGLSIYTDNNSVGIGRQVDTDFDLDLPQFFLDLLLLLRLAPLDEGLELAGNVGDLSEECEFAFVEVLILSTEAMNKTIHDFIKCRLDGIRNS